MNWYKTLVSRDTYMKVLKIQGIALGVCIGCIVIAHLMFALDRHRVANSSKLLNPIEGHAAATEGHAATTEGHANPNSRTSEKFSSARSPPTSWNASE